MRGLAIGDKGLDGAQRLGAALRVDTLLDEVEWPRLRGSRLPLANGHQQRGGNHQRVFHTDPPFMVSKDALLHDRHDRLDRRMLPLEQDYHDKMTGGIVWKLPARAPTGELSAPCPAWPTR